jgi:uncharacterized protein (TIGR02594 family)
MNKAFEKALSFYAEKEIVGSVDNPTIVQWFADIGHSWVKDDETAWCACFVNAMLKKAGLPNTGKLNARSFLEYGSRTSSPDLGDIVVLWRVKKNSTYGHVGFFVREKDGVIYILGGNQGNKVCISAYPKYRLLEYRKV